MNLSVNIQQDHSEAVIDLEHAQVVRRKNRLHQIMVEAEAILGELKDFGSEGTSRFSIEELIEAVSDIDGATAKGALHFDNGDLKGLTV